MFKNLLIGIFLLHCGVLTSLNSKAQCTATLNWDNLDYLTTGGTYSGFVTNAMALTQHFGVGSNRLTMAVSNSGSNWTLSGENTTHTGEGTSYGSGADVQFATSTSSVRTITLTFDVAVTTFRMSIYDIDASQRVTVSATNAGGSPVTVTLSKPGGATVVLANNPGNSPRGTGNGTNYANTSTNGTVNIDIAASVKTIVLSFNTAAGDFWLSDISACVASSYPTSYYLPAKPFTGQPGYVLSAVDNKVYYTNTSNGNSFLLFTDPSGNNINSVGYDHVRGYVYYAYSLTSDPLNNKALMKYDVNAGTISTVINNITTLGIPTFEYGMESGAGAFYNDQFFLGIEGYADDFSGSRKSMIWRIDFTGTVPTRATQVYASVADDGAGTVLHDWSDFAISNGILYDFDGAASDKDFFVYNMRTGALTTYAPASGVTPRQVAIGWNETVYNIDGNIAVYNGTNNFGTPSAITATPAIPGGASWGDAGEAFRPAVDFGDAPATYDPPASDPAVHESSQTTLRIGAGINIEVSKRGTTSTEDTYDDGIGTVSILLSGVSNYLVSVDVFNNTGSNATLVAWLDYNGNGIFESTEGISQTVNTSASVQSKFLFWPSINTTLPVGSFTYLRVRLTSTSNGMTTTNPTGYYTNGEVEDYRVNVDNYPLSSSLFSFDAKKTGTNDVKLTWAMQEESPGIKYELQKSMNSTNWSSFANMSSLGINGLNNYSHTDTSPYKGTSYYRLSWEDATGVKKYSAIRMITISSLSELIVIAPNPVTDRTVVTIHHTGTDMIATIKLANLLGSELYTKTITIRNGANPLEIPMMPTWINGIYTVQVTLDGEKVSRKIILRR